MTNRMSRCNEIGAMFTSQNPDERLRSIRVYSEHGSVHFVVEVQGKLSGEERSMEALQYLTPNEAMAMAKGLERSAIEALKNEDW